MSKNISLNDTWNDKNSVISTTLRPEKALVKRNAKKNMGENIVNIP